MSVAKFWFKLSFWRHLLVDYHNQDLCDLLQYGFPIRVADYRVILNQLHDKCKNHTGATQYLEDMLQYLNTELLAEAMLGQFKSNQFSHKIVLSPLNSVAKKIAVRS